ncbi:MAG TPA: iron-sulfur cluster assembly scaffold protein [Thermoplasmata archaeon]|nr:iron-sulfur cluster assembly scaffold protein [Thermoplasmata archaeon]
MEEFGPYTKKVIKHFRNPHNSGKIKNPSGVGKVGSPVCGDALWLYLKVEKDEEGTERIKDCKFETFGCVAAIASSSVITDMVKGKTLDEALKITKDKVVNSLGGLPKIKIHCSLLAIDGLVEAIYDYYKKSKKAIPKDLEAQHTNISKEREAVEKRYKQWMEMEEKVHNKEQT